MDVKSKCPYCSNANNYVKIDEKELGKIPKLVLCTNNACAKYYIATVKAVCKEFAVPDLNG